jgi:hypothetical protein
MMTQGWLWGADGMALGLLVVAAVADHRRHHRRDIDATGWVPWRGLQVAAFFGIIALTIIALKQG